jgi:hypothetical protein
LAGSAAGVAGLAARFNYCGMGQLSHREVDSMMALQQEEHRIGMDVT